MSDYTTNASVNLTMNCEQPTSTVTNLGGYVVEGNPQITKVICRVVTNPQQGCFYIKKVGNKATKVVF